MSTRARNARSFTLIELLVVVAIIALLISILLPSLARAKKNAKKSVCASNLHQIGLAMPAYTQENDDWYPSCPSTAWGEYDADGDSVMYNMVWMYGGEKGILEEFDRPAHKRPLYKYVYPEFFACPADRSAPDSWPADPNMMDVYTVGEATGNSYPMNAYNWNGWGSVYPKSFGRLGLIGRKTTQVTNLKCAVAGDAVMDEFWADVDPGYGPNPDDGMRWHDDSGPWANVVFVDGSVQFVLARPTDFHHRPRQWYWWENEDYSFCPTALEHRYEDPWYQPGH